MNEQEKPTEVEITGVEIPTSDLAWLIAKVIVISVLVSIPIYLIGLAAFVLIAVAVSVVGF